MPAYLVKRRTVTEATYKVSADDEDAAVDLVEEFDDDHRNVTFLDIRDDFDEFEAERIG